MIVGILEVYKVSTNIKMQLAIRSVINQLLQWILLPQGQQLVKKVGYVPIRE